MGEESVIYPPSPIHQDFINKINEYGKGDSPKKNYLVTDNSQGGVTTTRIKGMVEEPGVLRNLNVAILDGPGPTVNSIDIVDVMNQGVDTQDFVELEGSENVFIEGNEREDNLLDANGLNLNLDISNT